MPYAARVLPFVSTNPLITRIDYADVLALNPTGITAEMEADAYDHWIFDTGDSQALVGRTNGRSLTRQSAAPAYSSDHIVGGTYGNALLSDLNNREDFTVVATVKYPSSPGMVAGSVETTTNGASLLMGVSTSAEVSSFVRGPSTTQRELNLSSTPSAGSWIAVGMALDYSGSTRRRTLAAAGQSVEITNDSADMTINGTAKKIALGNAYYNSAPYNTTAISVHSFILYDRALTLSQLQGVLGRERLRGQRRGLTVL